MIYMKIMRVVGKKMKCKLLPNFKSEEIDFIILKSVPVVMLFLFFLLYLFHFVKIILFKENIVL